MAAGVQPRLSWEEQAQLPDPWAANSWGSRASQLVRFHAVLDAIQPSPGESLMDWGCGTGELFEGLPPGVHYVGGDPCPAMVERARRDHPRGQFIELPLPDPIFDRFDCVCAIGPFNVKPSSVAETLVSLAGLWDVTRRVLCVSVLRDLGQDDDGLNVRYPAGQLVELAESLTPRWRLRADHLPNDLLLTLWR